MKTVYEMTVQELVNAGFGVHIYDASAPAFPKRYSASGAERAIQTIQGLMPGVTIITGALRNDSYPRIGGARASNGKVSISIW